MKYIVQIILIIAVLTGCQKPEPVATKGNISGIVKEEGTNVPISGASVSIAGTEEVLTTEEDGSYKTSELFASDYTLTIQKLGYETKSSKFTVEPEKITQGDFFLKKDLPKVSPQFINLSNNRLTQAIQLENTRSGNMDFTIETSKPWIKASPKTGSIQSLNAKIINVTLDLTGVEYGDFDETLIINVGQASLSIPVYVSNIEPSYIRIESPILNDSISVGEQLTIQWSSNLDGSCKIELLHNNVIKQIIVPQTSNSYGGVYRWVIPEISSLNYQLRITSLEHKSNFAISDLFYIAEGPSYPSIETLDVTSVSTNEIIIQGEISKLGTKDGYISNYGHVYSTNNQNPSLSDNVVSLGETNKTLKYENTLSNLTEGQTYYIRAFATNAIGTEYGNMKIVTTGTSAPIVSTGKISNISQTSAIASATIDSDGGKPITQRGICFSTISPATIEARKVVDPNNFKGEYSVILNNLQKGTKYFVRAYAMNSTGLEYGDEIHFTTNGGIPQVSSISVSNLKGTNIEAKGILENNGGSEITSYGFCWNETGSPTLSNSFKETGKNTTGSYIDIINDLKPSSTYFIAAYATNNKGTAYGNTLSINTPSGLPTVKTTNANVLSSSEASLSGEITSKEGSETIAYGFCISTHNLPTLQDSLIKLGTDFQGRFNHKMTNLKAGTQYYFRAFATNSFGTSYGDVSSFYTQAGKPIVETTNANVTSPNNASLSGKIIENGGTQLSAYGFCWSRNSSPTISDNKIVVGTNITGGFAVEINTLAPETKYYIRAFATNPKGTSYGSIHNITTPKDAVRPTLSTLAAYATSATEAELKGELINNGDAPILSHGFCWSTTPAPTINEDKIILGTNIQGKFNGVATKLSPKTTYYARAYATNKKGTSYGEDISFNTPKDESVNFSSPYFGDVAYSARELEISWTSQSFDRRIVLVLFDGDKQTEIDNNVLLSDASYIWVVPENINIGKNNTIQILDYDNLDILSESATFEIKGLLKLSGEVELNRTLFNNNVSIEWYTNYSTELKIDLYQNSIFVKNLANNVNSSQSVYSWSPINLGISNDDGYRIKITDVNDNEITAISRIHDIIDDTYVDNRDNTKYRLVSIGENVWFSENLNYTDGTNNSNSWIQNENYYGVQYNAHRDFCPAGYHISTDDEWAALASYLSLNGYGNSANGGIAKALASNEIWEEVTGEGVIGNDLTLNNSSGFTALPGIFGRGASGVYTYNFKGGWWTSTKIDKENSSNHYLVYYTLYSGSSNLNRGLYEYQGNSIYYYVRCVKD